MRKTFIVEGLTNGATVGAAGVSAPLDITAPIIAIVPEAKQTPVTLRKYSSILTSITEEGGFKFFADRKAHINKYDTSDAIHGDQSVGGNTLGSLSTIKFKKSKRDPFEFEMNKSWDTGFVYDKKKDPKVTEGKMLKDLGSLKSDLDEVRASSYYTTLDSGITGTKAAKYGKYVSSIDEKTVDAPDILETLALAEAKTIDEKKLIAATIVDKMFNLVTEAGAMGRMGSTHAGYPYARGVKSRLGQEFTVKEFLVPIISLDPRFLETGLSEDMIKNGVIATVNSVPVKKDDYMDSNATKFDVELSGTGTYSPVIKGEEMADEFMLLDHPTKPTVANLLSGSGGFDTFVTPYINLSRFLKINITTTAADAPAVKSGK